MWAEGTSDKEARAGSSFPAEQQRGQLLSCQAAPSDCDPVWGTGANFWAYLVTWIPWGEGRNCVPSYSRITSRGSCAYPTDSLELLNLSGSPLCSLRAKAVTVNKVWVLPAGTKAFQKALCALLYKCAGKLLLGFCCSWLWPSSALPNMSYAQSSSLC